MLSDRSSRRRPVLVLCAALAALALAALPGPAREAIARLGAPRSPVVSPDTTVIFGPQQFYAAGSTAIHVEQFTEAFDHTALYVLEVTNGGSGGNTQVSDGTIKLNGVTVLAPADFQGASTVLTRTVWVADGTNTLQLELKGSSSGYVTARVLRILDADNRIYRRGFQKATSQSEVFADTFATPGGQAMPGRLYVEEETAQGTVVLNGTQVYPDPNCPSCAGPYDVGLQATNALEVTLTGGAGTLFAMSVEAVDTAGPVVTLTTPAEGTILGVTEVEFAGTVADATPPVLLTIDGDTVPVDAATGAFSHLVPLTGEGTNTITIVATDGVSGTANETEAVRTVFRDTQAPLLTIQRPEDEEVDTGLPLAEVKGSVQDATDVTVEVNGIAFNVDATGVFVGDVPLDEGVNFVTTVATDQAGNSASDTRRVIRDTQAPVLTVTAPANGSVVTDRWTRVQGSVSDATTVTLKLNGWPATLKPDNTFDIETDLAEGPNLLETTATDAAGNVAIDQRTITYQPPGSEPPLPPDPSTVAPALDRTVATTLHAATEFLYTGPDSIQTGVAAGTIEPVRAAVLRGRVLDRTGAPLSGVTITVLDHPEFGQTLSRADGWFDLVVNGGGRLTVDYAKSGFLPSQRTVEVRWQDYAAVDDVVLVPLDPQVTTVDLAASGAGIQVARGSVQTDVDGSRQATLLFEPGTTAEMVFPDGTRQAISTLSVRATEYTVGDSGPEAMPGELPPMSAYTYAVELSVDEARAAGATSVEFGQPVTVYVENFLDFSVGTDVPVGWYDRRQAAWAPEANGRIIRVLDTSSGVAQIDVDGDSVADADSVLASFGIGTDERVELAGLYTSGESLWRVRTTHFSPFDFNWPFWGVGLGPLLNLLIDSLDCPSTTSGSIIECESQVLGERLGIPGTGLTLNYRSSRVRGNIANRTLEIPLIGDSIPPNLAAIRMEVRIAGQVHQQTFTPTPNRTYTFVWDGNDAYGRPAQGEQPVEVELEYVYRLYYTAPLAVAQSFGLPCEPIAADPTLCFVWGGNLTGRRGTQGRTTVWRGRMGTWDAPAMALGGWSVGVHHAYNPVSNILYRGDGTQRSADAVTRTGMSIVAGSSGGGSGFAGDGGAATSALLNRPRDAAIGPDGSIYIADTRNHRIRKVDANGIITTIAGTGTAGYGGDGGPATLAQFNEPWGLALGRDGSLYVADRWNRRVRRIAPDGTITTVAGTGTGGYSGDGGLATQAQFWTPEHLAIGPDGSIYVSDYVAAVVRRIGVDGRIHTVAGDGTACDTWVLPSCGDGRSALRAPLGRPLGLDVGPDGSLYVATWDNVVRRVAPDGIITRFAGRYDGSYINTSGVPADQSDLDTPQDVTVGPDGSVYIIDANDFVHRVGPDGIIAPVVGVGRNCGFACLQPYEPGLATQTRLVSDDGLTVGPDGSLYVLANLTTFYSLVYRVRPLYPGAQVGEISIASSDASMVYQFDAAGRHQRTVDAHTGAVLYQFGYDAAGRLMSIADRDSLVTTIERASDGTPQAFVAPFGQRTALTVDSAGYLSEIVNPAADTIRVAHAPDGLLTSLTSPSGHASAFIYDSIGRLTRDDNAAGGFKSLTPTVTGRSRTVSVATAMGRTTTYEIEGLPTGGIRRVRTDPNGLSTESITEPNDSSRTLLPDGTVVTAVAVSDPRFAAQASYLTLYSVATPGGLTMTLTGARHATLADPADPLSLVSQVDSVVVNGRVSTSVYDAAQRQYTTTSAEGRQSVTRVDSLGRPTEVQIAGVTPVSYGYNALGQLTTVTQGTRSWSYTYDASGRLESATDPLGRVELYGYDLADRLTRQILPDSTEIGYGYDASGNLDSLTPPGQPAHAFSFTAVDLAETYTPPSAGGGTWATQFAYNLDQQPTAITRPDGLQIGFGYDAAGRLDTVSTPTGAYVYGYDPATGQVSSLSAPGGVNLSYGYDGSLPTSVTWTGPVAGSVGVGYDHDFRAVQQTVNGAHAISLGYDLDGLLTSAGALTLARDPQNGFLTGTTLGAVTQAVGYSGFGELAGDTVRLSGADVYAVRYSRDVLGRIDTLTETVQGVTTVRAFAYDSIGRLKSVTRDGVAAGSWEYDANGNRTRAVLPGGALIGAYDAQDRLLSYGNATYAYTAAGELREKVEGVDTTRYTYDVLGNLRAVALPDGTQIGYVIDGQGRRVGRTVNGVLVQGWLYQDALNPVAELDGAGNVVSRFVYGSKPHVPDYLVRGGVTYRLISDHLGSVRLVVDVASGTVVQRLDYDVWGRVTSDSNPGFQPFGFAGGLYDAQTHLVRFGARDYDPWTGRWTNKDPIGFEGGDTNLYGYVLADPVNLVDPTGELIWVVVAGGAVGAAVNVAAVLLINGGDVSGRQVAAAALGGFAAGSLGVLAGPAGGTLARAITGSATGGLARAGAIGLSGLAGALGQGVANIVDPCNASSLSLAALLGALGGAAGSTLSTPRNLYTLKQGWYFANPNLSNILRTQSGRYSVKGGFVSSGVAAAGASTVSSGW